jgi:hypothetical protein
MTGSCSLLLAGAGVGAGLTDGRGRAGAGAAGFGIGVTGTLEAASGVDTRTVGRAGDVVELGASVTGVGAATMGVGAAGAATSGGATSATGVTLGGVGRGRGAGARSRGAGVSGTASRSRLARSVAVLFVPDIHGTGVDTWSIESQSGDVGPVARADEGAASRDSPWTLKRSGIRRLRQASSTSGAASRCTNGAGAKLHSERRKAPSSDIGCASASVTPLSRPRAV